MNSSDDSYKLLTSLRYDPFLRSLRWNDDKHGPSEFMLLPYHFTRLAHAASQHGWHFDASGLTQDALKAICHQAVSSHHNAAGVSAYKLRVTLSKNGVFEAEASPIPGLTADPMAVAQSTLAWEHCPDSLLSIAVDTEHTPTSLFTSTKTTQRSVYDAARIRNGVAGPHDQGGSGPTDVLLWNRDHLIMETSIFNVAFYRDSSWITPSPSTGCLPGVLRQWLLGQNLIQEPQHGPLDIGDINEGDFVLLFNGVQGCKLGRIRGTRVQ
ncbi:hypothetical protein BDN72DRAFT_808283 [Pluteus cervinus]|uniref:Uncharacterized protein n=1 Tax=Pluteus cervinus TaxID=181527 RepID=A0ACD3BHR3_9AGAR|nr:hypothetical protein BDN72DRAFT_808283 [Pluteus cervinus]